MSTSTVSATGVQDPSGQVFANGTWSLYFTPTFGRSGPFTDGGVVFTKIYGGSLDATGSFSQAGVNRSDTISPGGSTWLLTVTPAVGGLSFQVALNVNSPAFDCTAAINAAITAKAPGGLTVNPTSITRAYKDAEVINIDGAGGIYYDEILKQLKIWDAATGVWLTTSSMIINGYVDLVTNQSVAGIKTFTSDTILKSINAQTWVMADQFANIQAAINALPATGGVVDARSPNVNLTMGAIDVGSNSKPVTLLLGPFTYTFTQITIRQGFNILGAGIINTLLNNNGLNATPAFVIPQVNNNAITVHWSDFTVNALVGNTSQKGLFADTSTLTNAGLELSNFANIIFAGFFGTAIHLKATLDGVSGSVGDVQMSTFVNVTAHRPTGATGAGQNSLRIEGGCGQLDFYDCIFDGVTNDTGTNVFVGTTGIQAPYSIHFHNCTNQNGFAYLIDGGTSITFENDHFENIKGCYNIANTSQLVVGVNIKTPHINGNVGVNAGNGYVVNIPNTVTNAEVTLDTPFVYSTPDKLVNNAAGNAASVKIKDVRTFNSSTPTNVYATVGVTGTLNAAATVDLKGWNSVQVNASATSMTTFKSTLSPGETVTLYATGGSVQFATGGNLSLGNNISPFVLQSGDSATFMRVDQGTPVFILVGYTQQGKVAVDLPGQTANIGSTLLYAVPATGAGTYKVTVYIIVTTVGTTSTMPNIVIGFTDKDNNTVQSVPFTVTNAGNTLTTLAVNSLPISVKASTNINYSTTGYASTGTAMQYALHIKLEYMGS